MKVHLLRQREDRSYCGIVHQPQMLLWNSAQQVTEDMAETTCKLCLQRYRRCVKPPAQGYQVLLKKLQKGAVLQYSKPRGHVYYYLGGQRVRTGYVERLLADDVLVVVPQSTCPERGVVFFKQK